MLNACLEYDRDLFVGISPSAASFWQESVAEASSAVCVYTKSVIFRGGQEEEVLSKQVGKKGKLLSTLGQGIITGKWKERRNAAAGVYVGSVG